MSEGPKLFIDSAPQEDRGAALLAEQGRRQNAVNIVLAADIAGMAYKMEDASSEGREQLMAEWRETVELVDSIGQHVEQTDEEKLVSEKLGLIKKVLEDESYRRGLAQGVVDAIERDRGREARVSEDLAVKPPPFSF